MDELVRELLGGEEAWYVGGAVRDRLLGRPLVDVDVACREPERAARAYGRRSGGASFPLSERHGAWRVALGGGRTVDFTPLRGTIEKDLASRDFALNAIAVSVAGGDHVDPFDGRGDIERRTIRALGDRVFRDDPLRLLRAVRQEDELGFRLDPVTEGLVRRDATLATLPSGERIVAELVRLGAGGWERLDELGLLDALGGHLHPRLRVVDTPEYRLVVALGDTLARFPVSNELRRYARTLLGAAPPADASARSIHRFRRATEPWSLDVLALHGRDDLRDAVERARAAEPGEPLLRGDELGVPPGPEIGRLLALVDEERAAGAISTRDEALALVRRERR